MFHGKGHVLYSSIHSPVFGVQLPSQAPAALTMTSLITTHCPMLEKEETKRAAKRKYTFILQM
jgi:hypothetical protein